MHVSLTLYGFGTLKQMKWYIQILMQSFEVEELPTIKISYSAIKEFFLFQYQPEKYFIITEVASSTGEHMIQAFNLQLEPVWGFKCNLLRMMTSDRLTRMVMARDYELDIQQGAFEQYGILILTRLKIYYFVCK